MADEVLLHGVQGITDLINVPGLINTDFADVKMVMSNAGSAIMGIGTGSGEGRAVNAARHAITSPLLEASIEGARGILLNIAGGSDLTLVRGERGRRHHPRRRPPRRQHHLRQRHRRRPRRHGAGDGHRGRLRPLRRAEEPPGSRSEHDAASADGRRSPARHQASRPEPAEAGEARHHGVVPAPGASSGRDVFDVGGDDDLDLDDDFDVPSFLR